MLKTGRVRAWFSANYANFARFVQMPKCSNQQIKISCGNSFPNCTILCMNMYTSSKVTHAKYAVAETRIPSVKRITVIPVLRNL